MSHVISMHRPGDRRQTAVSDLKNNVTLLLLRNKHLVLFSRHENVLYGRLLITFNPASWTMYLD
jgi:hypothetical protein